MKAIIQICKFAGILFMAVSTFLFYNSLFVAYGNPGFFTWIYFDAFNEGFFELIVFIIVIPFIALALVLEGINLRKTLQESKEARHEILEKRNTN